MKLIVPRVCARSRVRAEGVARAAVTWHFAAVRVLRPPLLPLSACARACAALGGVRACCFAPERRLVCVGLL
eukprot:563159-Prymnesium_polylepis.1